MIKQIVFKKAWDILKYGYAKTFSEALTKAWKIIKMNLGQSTTIFYNLVKGGVRRAVALQVDEIDTINKDYIRYKEYDGGVICWRTFKVSNLIIE